ncbi:MAG: hypothetical protein ACLURV_11035 [Gallintestinimicrobium sp.]
MCSARPYDGFDETEDSTFPNMLIETAKLENYIQKISAVSSLRHTAVLWAAPLWDLWCSAKKSISGTESSEAPIWIRAAALEPGRWQKAMTPLLGKMLRSGKLPVWAKRKWKKKRCRVCAAMLQLFGCSAATQELPSMAFVSNTSIFNQFFSDMVTPLEDDIYVPERKFTVFMP